MNLAEAFAHLLETITGETFNDTIFVGEAPASGKVAEAIWWITAFGGQPPVRLVTGEVLKSYQVEIRRRDRDGKAVYDAMYTVEEAINNESVELDGFVVYDISALALPIDEDQDLEGRKVGLLQVTITIYEGDSHVFS